MAEFVSGGSVGGVVDNGGAGLGIGAGVEVSPVQNQVTLPVGDGPAAAPDQLFADPNGQVTGGPQKPRRARSRIPGGDSTPPAQTGREYPAVKQPDPVTEGGEGEDNPKAPKRPVAQEVLKPVDIAKLQREYMEYGKLTEHTYNDVQQRLVAAGFDAKILDYAIENQVAAQENFNHKVANLFGGPENVQAAVQWAKENLSETEQIEFNRRVENTTDPKEAFRVAEWLHEQWRAENPKQGQRVAAENVAPPGVKPFENLQEVAAAQRDPKYATDPEYRKQVLLRIQAAVAAGTIRM